MDTRQYSPLLEISEAPAVKSSKWGHAELTAAVLEPVMAKMLMLLAGGLKVGMVIKEFVRTGL